jgi:nitroimidazol reductase NimA-like FMN-containing flavoprotein (pyridoxamine 5'-phosphate oxidase superfamily)
MLFRKRDEYIMNKKGILVLNYQDKQRKLNFATDADNKLVVITSGRSNKVAFMKENDSVSLQFGEEVVTAKPEIITNQDEVKALFDFMTSEDNNHFKAYNDIFVAVKFSV